MRLAVSNIAWRVEEAEAALDRLEALDVPGLEIAPGLAFAGEADPVRPDTAAVALWGSRLERRGLALVSMQSLLFARARASLFGDEAGRQVFVGGMEAAIQLAGRLGCPNLVLGSPAARRIPDTLDAQHAMSIALDMIGQLGDRCEAIGASLSVEPNPVAYGANFLNTFAETVAFVRRLGHPAVKINLDLGALTMNGETAAVLRHLPEHIETIGHVHISEPELAFAPADALRLTNTFSALRRAGYGGWVSIEMRSTDGENLERLTTSVLRAQTALRQSEGRAG
jgi:sugar phosphate isomerase/epimerase